MRLYRFLSVLSIIYPDEDPLVSKHLATETTMIKIVLIVFTYWLKTPLHSLC